MGLEIERLLEREKERAKCAVLFAIAQNGTRQAVLRWDFQTAPLNVRNVIDEAEERALRQANVLGGVHVFLFEVYADPDGLRPLGSEPFRVSGEVLPNGVSIAHEPANEGGLVAQLLRHNEARERLSIQRDLGSVRALEVLSRHVERIESRHGDLLVRLEELTLGERETKIALLKEEGAQKLKLAAFDKLGNLLPEVAGAITGKLSGTTGAAAAIKAKAAFSTITHTQLTEILKVLSPDQQVALMGLFRTLMEDEEKERQSATH